MSTATSTRTRPPARQVGSSGNVITSWLNSWAVALRIGRRDAWRHKGRSILILVMICLPVALISGVFTALKTADLDAVDRLPSQLGSAQAVVRVGDQPGRRVVQSLDGMQMAGDGAPSAKSAPLPGTTAASTTAQVAPAVRTYLHATKVVPIAQTSAVSEFDGHRRTTMILRIDPTADAARDMVDLVDGRWPENADEVVVTRSGRNLGLPESGTITIGAETTDVYASLPGAAPATGPTRSVRVVGIADTAADLDVHLVLADSSPANATGLLVERDTPVTWAEVKDANLHGLTVVSRDVVANPPPVNEQYVEMPGYAYVRGFVQTVPAELMAVLCTGVFIACGLLAGPAFTVVAARQRRTLAMIASNGATGGQLRRAMLGQALVLGVGGAVLGAALGIGSIPPLVAVLDAWRPTVADATWHPSSLGPLDVPWPQVLLIVGSAALAAVVAAVLPARGLSNLDVVAALRGDIAPKRARRRLPVIGLVLFALGAFGLWWIFDTSRVPYYGPANTVNTTAVAVISCLMLVAGALMAVPMILVGVAWLLRRAPLPVRMAARDAARQRGRATSTVAAVMAGTIILAGSLVLMASLDAHARATYVPSAPKGIASVGPIPGTTSPDWARLIATEAPGAVSVTAYEPRSATNPRSAEKTTAGALTAWTLVPGHCTSAPGGGDTTCPSVRFGDDGYSRQTVTIVDPAALDRVIPLKTGDRAALGRGELLTTVSGFTAGRATLTEQRTPVNADGVQGTPTDGTVQQVTVSRASTTALGEWNPDGHVYPAGGLVLMTEATARRLGIDGKEPGTILTRTPQPLTHGQVRRINQAAADELGVADTSYFNPLEVERGYESPVHSLMLALALATLALIVLATVTATALAVGEARRDLRVVAVLGSTPSTPRAMAAALAAITAGVGTLAGYAVGLIPGTLAASELTRRSNAPRDGGLLDVHDVVIPWLPLAGTLVVATVVAALAAWLLVRPNVDLARRDSRG